MISWTCRAAGNVNRHFGNKRAKHFVSENVAFLVVNFKINLNQQTSQNSNNVPWWQWVPVSLMSNFLCGLTGRETEHCWIISLPFMSKLKSCCNYTLKNVHASFLLILQGVKVRAWFSSSRRILRGRMPYCSLVFCPIFMQKKSYKKPWDCHTGALTNIKRTKFYSLDWRYSTRDLRPARGPRRMSLWPLMIMQMHSAFFIHRKRIISQCE